MSELSINIADSNEMHVIENCDTLSINSELRDSELNLIFKSIPKEMKISARNMNLNILIACDVDIIHNELVQVDAETLNMNRYVLLKNKLDLITNFHFERISSFDSNLSVFGFQGSADIKERVNIAVPAYKINTHQNGFLLNKSQIALSPVLRIRTNKIKEVTHQSKIYDILNRDIEKYYFWTKNLNKAEVYNLLLAELNDIFGKYPGLSDFLKEHL